MPTSSAILHFSHFMELILKYYVTQAHPLLIYKNPFAKSLGERVHHRLAGSGAVPAKRRTGPLNRILKQAGLKK